MSDPRLMFCRDDIAESSAQSEALDPDQSGAESTENVSDTGPDISL